jgi:hypothetical protein
LSVASLLSFVGALTAINDFRNYNGYIRAEVAADVSKSAVTNVERDLAVLFKVIRFPAFSIPLNLLDLNFTKIEPEIELLTSIAPELMGRDKPKKYLLIFQNSAEARGTGGILGAYAVIETNQGEIKVIRTASNVMLHKMSRSSIPGDMPEEFIQLYGQNPSIFQNSNLSPHFPYGADIWTRLWKQQYGESFDGVIAVDPIVLGYILRATGEITLQDGEKINSTNVVEKTLKTAYERFEFDNEARKKYLVKILNAALEQIQANNFSKLKMAQAIRDSILENRVLFYSKETEIERRLAKTRLGGFMSTTPNKEFRTVIQNIDASKLDYYLDREVAITSQSCGKNPETEVKIRVTNSLVSGKGLPAYVLTRADKGKPVDLVTGAHRFKVFIYGPVGAKLVSASRENRTAKLGGSSTERERPIYVADVDLKPGESEELLANFSGGTGKISFIDQPLVRTTKISIADNC